MPAEPPPRNVQMEKRLCEAIRGRRVLLLRYAEDERYRLFLPHAVFYGPDGMVLVDGGQITELGRPFEEMDMRTLEVRRIIDVRITDRTFTPHQGFDLRDSRYTRGVICSVSEEDSGRTVH